MNDKAVKLVCPMCGGETFVDGTIIDIVYVPQKTTHLKGMFTLLWQNVRGSVPTKTCIACGFAAIIIPPQNRV